MDKPIPKKLLVVTSTFPRWSNDTEPPFVIELCKRLVKLGLEVDVLAPHAKSSKRHEVIEGMTANRYMYCIPQFEILAYSGGIMSNIRKNKLLYLLVPFFVFSQALAIRRQLKSTDYFAIHAHWIFPQGFICAFVCMLLGNKNIPILCTSHGGDLFSLQSKIFIKLKKWTVSRVKKMTVVSNYMREYCVENLSISNEKLAVISMGVDLDNLFIPNESVQRKNNRVIFVGRFVEKKGITFLIEAISLVKNHIPNIELLLIGDGPLHDELTVKINNHNLNDNVKIIGSVKQSELPALYSSARIAVTPSIVDKSGDQEGLGLVIIEALGCGCAVIASKLEAIKDIINDGENGLLVKPGDAISLAEKIMQLILDSDLSSELSKNGMKSVYNKFNWDIIAKRYHQLIIGMDETNEY